MSNPPAGANGDSASDPGPSDSATACKPDESSSAEAAKAQDSVIKAEPEAATSSTDSETKNEKKTTASSTSSNDSDDADDDKSIKSEGADEEDALFTSLEQKEEKEEASHPHEQPKNAKAAPRLLQSALAKGDLAVKEEEKKGEETADDSAADGSNASNVVHQRVRNEIQHTYEYVSPHYITAHAIGIDDSCLLLSRLFYTSDLSHASKPFCSSGFFLHFRHGFSAKPTRLFAVQGLGIQQLYL